MSERRTILLVEDDRDEIDIALRALGRVGLDDEVAVARDGVEALERLGLEDGDEDDETRAALAPRVVFLDLKMPRIDGWQVLERIRRDPRTADLPVVVLSSSERREDIERSYALGANSFVSKRFQGRSPGHYIAEAARYWLELNRTPRQGV